jgi:hypothetical protein
LLLLGIAPADAKLGVDPSAGRMALPVMVSLEKPAGRLSGGRLAESCLRGDLRSRTGVAAAAAALAEGEEGGREPSLSRGVSTGCCC